MTKYELIDKIILLQKEQELRGWVTIGNINKYIKELNSKDEEYLNTLYTNLKVISEC